MTIYYDNKFNQNEIFIIVLLLAYGIIFLFPKRFPLLISVMVILYGPASALFMDHAISITPIDFYDVNDSSHYTIMDFLLYCAYGPFCYFLIYFFDKFKLKAKHAVFYIPICSAISAVFELIAVHFKVFHFKNGYETKYSFPIYLIVFSVLFVLYFKVYVQKKRVLKY